MIANGHCRDVEESFDEIPDYSDIDIRQWPKTDDAERRSPKDQSPVDRNEPKPSRVALGSWLPTLEGDARRFLFGVNYEEKENAKETTTFC